MKKRIRILLLEDVKTDAELVRQALRRGGVSFALRRVETEGEFLQELERHRPDVILSDHGFPEFDGFKALELAQGRCPEVPFIFVTGAMGEEVAVASFKNGATDYILKSRLSQLPRTVERALHEGEDRAARSRLEGERDQLIQELKDTLTRIKTLTGVLPICASCKSIHDQQHGWQPFEAYLQTHSEATLTHEICPTCLPKTPQDVSEGAQGRAE